MKSDVSHERKFLIKTIPVEHDLETIQNLVTTHARLINYRDIDYELFTRNSNTYYGDITKIVTGNEPPDFSYSGGVLRYFPAINKDLIDYCKTEFAEKFSCTPSEIVTHTTGQHHMHDEDYSNGYD